MVHRPENEPTFVAEKNSLGCKDIRSDETEPAVLRKDTRLCSIDTTEVGESLSRAIYNDIKSNNATPDVNSIKVTRATDPDIATFGSVSHDPGDLTCPGVNIVEEDEFDPSKALSSSDHPKVHVEGPSLEVGSSPNKVEKDNSVPVLPSTIPERGTCPPVDHSNGDIHPKIDHFMYNSACVKN